MLGFGSVKKYEEQIAREALRDEGIDPDNIVRTEGGGLLRSGEPKLLCLRCGEHTMAPPNSSGVRCPDCEEYHTGPGYEGNYSFSY